MERRTKVLVVDDDKLVLKLTRARLESAGYEVVTRSESLGTSQAIVEEAPDVVLLDINMPALAGDTLAEIVRRNPRAADVPIIFHSGEALSVVQSRARDVGALGALPKTDDDASFLAQFERLLKRAV